MVAAIDGPLSGQVENNIDITGSAWIDTGEYNPAEFDRYSIHWADDGGSDWTLIVESTSQMYDEVIATWNTSGMEAGEYDLQLAVYSTEEDTLTAPADITLHPLGIESHGQNHCSRLSYPNPFTSGAAFTYSLAENEFVVFRLYDASGRLVDTVVNENQTTGYYSMPWGTSDSSASGIATGIYFCCFQVGNEFSQTGKLLFLR